MFTNTACKAWSCKVCLSLLTATYFPVMGSLKRQRASLEPSQGGQKRARSNPFFPNSLDNDQVIQFQGSLKSSVPAPVVTPKRCIHKIVTACSLSQATCCACADARPEGFNFVRYLDGHAWGLTESRWEYYCFDCKSIARRCFSLEVNADMALDYWVYQNNLGHRHRQPLIAPEAKDVPDTIRVSYDAWSIDIIRSVDLTLDSLRAEVARLTWCDPSQLTVVRSSASMGRAFGLSGDNALTSYTTHIAFGRNITVESEDSAMEHVQYNLAEHCDAAVRLAV
jgi:hypothetical protein